MFEFANGLLLLMLAGMVLCFEPMLRNRAPLQDCLCTEHFLFCGRGAARREAWGQRAFLAGLALYEFEVVFCNSMARENWPWLQTGVKPVLEWVLYLCFAFKLLVGTKYRGYEFIGGTALFFIVRWVYFNGQNIWFFGMAVAILSAKDVPLRRSMRAFLGSGVPSLALVEVLHFAGIIAPDATSERDGSFRLMFGYGHPNTFGGVVVGLVLAWVLLRRERLRLAEIAGVAAAAVFLYVAPQSRSAAMCLFLLAVLLLLVRLCARGGKRHTGRVLPALCAAVVPVMVAVSFILPLFVVKIGPWSNDVGPAWIKKLDDLLTCRISMVWAAYRVLDVKIAGQMLNDWPVLDNIWVFLFYLTGPVMAAIAAVLVMYALYACAKRGRGQLVACMFAMLAYGYMETQVIHVTTNPSILLLSGAVYALPPKRFDEI